MTTIHEQAADVALSSILSDPEGAAEFARVRADLKAGRRFKASYVDTIGQIFRSSRNNWPLNQVAAFVCVFAGRHVGNYGQIRIGRVPSPQPDRCRAENAAAVADLPGPFRAVVDVDQNCADQDGYLEWDEPILVERTVAASLLPSCPRDYAERLIMPHHIGPGRVPLEIGYTMPSRTLCHLDIDGGVARWPYDADVITLFVNLTNPLEKLGL
jgi:hypothetical protein